MDANKLILESVAADHGLKETDPSPGAIIEWLFQKLSVDSDDEPIDSPFASSLPFNAEVDKPEDYGTTVPLP